MISARNVPQKDLYSLLGFRNWYKPLPFIKRTEAEIYVVDFETLVYSEESEEERHQFNHQGQRNGNVINGLIVYFLYEGGEKGRAFLRANPYFYLSLGKTLAKSAIQDLKDQIRAIDSERIVRIEEILELDSEDLTFPEEKLFLKIEVRTPSDVPKVRDRLEELSGVLEWREADVLFHHRVAIDEDVRVGTWYRADLGRGEILSLRKIPEKAPPDLKILAYDIETNNPLTRGPNLEKDSIVIISAFSGEKNLVFVNADMVETSEIKNIDVILKKEDSIHELPWVDWVFSGLDKKKNLDKEIHRYPVEVRVVKDERALLEGFFGLLSEVQPDVITDFYGDKFDIPFLVKRSRLYELDFLRFSGFKPKWNLGARDKQNRDLMRDIDFFGGAGVMHLNAFLWNEKYSYLPKKDLSLKASVRKKLKIIPIGREALETLEEDPPVAIAYSASDAYITWRYVREIILGFVLALGQLFPVPAEDLLTRRSGSLDDLLIDSEGHRQGIVGRRRFSQKGLGKFSSNLNIKTVTYTGGLVEARNPGIWRSDLKYPTSIDPCKIKRIIENLPSIVQETADEFLENTKKQIIEEFFLSQELSVRFSPKESSLESLDNCLKISEVAFSPEEFETFRKQVDDLKQLLHETTITNKDSVTQYLTSSFEKLLNGKEQKNTFQGIHLDVTSMYPSQIRQYKLQPSGIVSPEKCLSCSHKENESKCYLNGQWTLRIDARKPCQRRNQVDACKNRYCKYSFSEEDTCPRYNPGKLRAKKSREVFTYEDGQVRAYSVNGSDFHSLKLQDSFLGRGILGNRIGESQNLFEYVSAWVSANVQGTQVVPQLTRIDSTNGVEELPLDNAFLYLDARSQHVEILVSVNSRVCQKAFDFVSRIIDDFFRMRVHHKGEAALLKRQLAKLIQRGKTPPEDLYQRQRYHESTAVGLKVPLNSVYGLLGMKSGVHNASTPCAGITTFLSADLIRWAADYISGFGCVTELDTDGVWAFISTIVPLNYSLQVSGPTVSQERDFSVLENILNYEVKQIKSWEGWKNDSKTIEKREKSCLLQFEQDGPYDFMYIMGKKKYVVYNHAGDKNRINGREWIEEEVTGLETKRADFSRLVKKLQNQILKAFMSDFEKSDLKSLYSNALEKAAEFIADVRKGKVDPDLFLLPRAIARPLDEYRVISPQVVCARMLQELGHRIEPGTRIEMYLIKTPSKRKSDSVIPRQLFDYDFKTVSQILIKKGISPLLLSLGEIKNKKDLLAKILDIDLYVQDLIGPGKLVDRMVLQPMNKQGIDLPIPAELDHTFKHANGEINPLKDWYGSSKGPKKPRKRKKKDSDIQKLAQEIEISSFYQDLAEISLPGFFQEDQTSISLIQSDLWMKFSINGSEQYWCSDCSSILDHSIVTSGTCPRCQKSVNLVYSEKE